MKKTILFIASILNLVLSLQAQNNNQSNYVFGDTVDEEYLKKQFSNKSDFDYWFANPNATFIDQDWNSSFSIDLPDYAVFPVDAFTVIDNRSYFPIMELPFKKVKIKDPDRDSTFIADVAFKNTQAKSDLIVSKDLFNKTLANLDQLNFKFANFPILTKLELQSNFTRIPSDIENAHNLRELVLASPIKRVIKCK